MWAFRSVRRLLGWFVDDVAITGTSASSGSSGTLVISKNIGQGSYTLTGPVSQAGSGLLTTISNAPLGQYNGSIRRRRILPNALRSNRHAGRVRHPGALG